MRVSALFDIPRIGTGLAFAEAVPQVERVLAASARAVVQAPPGSGKTTLVPPVVASVCRESGSPGRVVVTSPRRLTARSGAARLAVLSGTRLGGPSGYTVRGDRAVGPGTIVEFVTPGVLLRRLLRDPELPGVAAVVLDEVHERALDADLAMAMLSEVAELRDDLRLVAMSATLNSERFAHALGGEAAEVPVVRCEAEQHPLSVTWIPFTQPRTDRRGVSRTFLDHVATVTCAEFEACSPEQDALVFVPGAWEVDHVVGVLRRMLGGHAEVLPLHGRLPAAEQDAAIGGTRPGGRRRIVVSTSVAESSLTVPGVRLVIDSGLAREPRRDAARGMSGLVTVACSRESAVQRAGRAARLGPGRVVRCYDEETYARMRAATTPQIATADLTSAALFLAAWGTPGGAGLRLLDPPPPAALADAHRTLAELGAVDDGGRITPEGRRLVALPLDPRHARALQEGAALVGARTASEVAAALSADARSPEVDLTGLLRTWTGAGRRSPAALAWRREADRLQRALPPDAGESADRPSGRVTRHRSTEMERPAGREPGHATTSPVRKVGSAEGAVVALAYPDRVARLVQDGVYLLASGTRAALPPEAGTLAGSQWLAVAEVTRAEGRRAAGTGAVIRSAAPLEEADAMLAAQHLTYEGTRAWLADGRVQARRTRSLGAIELSSSPVQPTSDEVHEAVRDALEREGLGVLTWSEPAEALRRRLHLLRSVFGEPWPDVTDAGLLARQDEWLGALLACTEGQKGPAGRASLRMDAGVLRGLVPWPEAGRVDELAPEALPVASGSRIRLAYPPVTAADAQGDEPGRVVAAVKLQECFGMSTSPLLAEGRVRVQFHLLSPARRPLAVTDDLASFWNGPYRQARAEMRGRYPKHPWPEDPWNASATARTARATRGRG